MGTRTISVEDLASLEFVINVFAELTPGNELQSFDCDLPSVSVISTGGVKSGNGILAESSDSDELSEKSPDSPENCAVKVVKSPDLKGLQIYRVSEKLYEQSLRLKKVMFFHISQGRARGTKSLVLQRLATIRRVVNLERLALFQEAEQMELVLEFLFRSLTQIKWGSDVATQRFESLHEYSKEVIRYYIDVKIRESYREDFHLVQIEEMKRLMRMQMIHEQKKMHDEMQAGEELVLEVTRKNERLCSYFDQVAGKSIEKEARLLRWDLALAMRALAGEARPEH